MRIFGSIIFMTVWFPAFAIAFVRMTILAAVVDAYQTASRAEEWLYDE